jgi:hypothetical protein
VNCVAVRELLPEHALGVGERDGAALDKHLTSCAACRKEARDLTRAAATLAWAAAPSAPPPELEDRIVAAVGDAAGTVRPLRGRTWRRRTGAVLLAATLALAGLGTGVVVANRASRIERQVEVADVNRGGLAAFADIVGSDLSDPDMRAFLGVLASDDAEGDGSALVLASPSTPDQAVVLLSGLRDRAPLFPYTVVLVNRAGEPLRVGTVDALDTSGGATVARTTARELSGSLHVIVRDGRGKTALSGDLEVQTPLVSPSP